MPRASMSVKDFSRPHEVCTPPQGPPILPHSRIYTSAFAFHCIRASAFTPPHSRCTHAAAFSPHPCNSSIDSIDATALQLPRPHRTYSAALTPQHVSCSSHAASFLSPHSRRRPHRAASMLPLSHPCIHATALML